MKLTITLSSEDDCAVTNPAGTAYLAVAPVLSKLKFLAQSGDPDQHWTGICRDENGNEIGRWEFSP